MATGGSCSFTAGGGSYVFNADPTLENYTFAETDFSGTYTAPVL